MKKILIIAILISSLNTLHSQGWVAWEDFIYYPEQLGVNIDPYLTNQFTGPEGPIPGGDVNCHGYAWKIAMGNHFETGCDKGSRNYHMGAPYGY